MKGREVTIWVVSKDTEVHLESFENRLLTTDWFLYSNWAARLYEQKL